MHGNMHHPSHKERQFSMTKRLSLGIDTSNYKTSVAVIDEYGNIIADFRRFLEVKPGERGLRQSDALFQHVNSLPALLEQAFGVCKNIGDVVCVSASDRPRPVEGSYMPVFNAGVSFGCSISVALGVEFKTFSHQEGHIKAASYYTSLRDLDEFCAFHFSGGTTECIHVKNGVYELCGGTLDIAYGQVLDRVGVALGMEFPAGEELDNLVMEGKPDGGAKEVVLPKIKSKDGFVNLSGIETRCQRLIESGEDAYALSEALFVRISQSICDMVYDVAEKTGCRDFLFAGGVSASRFVRKYIGKYLRKDIKAVFCDGSLSCDNAVGTALLGGDFCGA